MINHFPINKQARSHNKEKIVPTNTSKLEKITKEIYNNANVEFKKSFPDFEFADAEVMVPELNLSKTPTHEQRRQEIRKSAQVFKKSVEKQKKETAVLRAFGTEVSLSKRTQLRMAEYFETPEKCKMRTAKDKEEINSNKKTEESSCPYKLTTVE